MNPYHRKSRFLFATNTAFAVAFAVIFLNSLIITPANAATEWHIRDDATGGECSVIGIWNAGSKTCTLSQDLSQGIIIDSDNITLDGDGHTITGSPEMRAGVYLFINGSSITIKGLKIQGFGYGIFLSSGNINNILVGNTLSNNYYGIYISGGAYRNTLTGNIISNNSEGLHISHDPDNNKIYNVYNNDFISNSIQVISLNNVNIVNLAAQTGGNYWSDYDTSAESCNDTNKDGFCDAPYIFTGGQDNLPWIKKDGWLVPPNLAPTALANILHNNALSSVITAPTIADPVNSVFGNYLYQAQDTAVGGRTPLVFNRTYNSHSQEQGQLGFKWTHNYNIHLKLYDDGAVVVNGDGRWDLFNKNSNGSYAPQAGVFDTLTKNNDGSFTLTKKDQTIYRFTDAGKLITITDRNGNALRFTYNDAGRLISIGDSAGRKLSFSLDTTGRIVTVSDPASHAYHYSYDDAGNLASYADPTGAITRYTYDSNRNLLTITDPNGHVLATNVYDEKNRVISQKDARGNEGKFQYKPDEKITIFTNARSNATEYRYDEKNRVTRIVDAQRNETKYAFDDNNNRTAITDTRGNTTRFAYDSHGNTLSITNPLGDAVEFSYDGRDNLISSKDAKGNTTAFAYDERGNLVSVSDAFHSTTAFVYNNHGDRVQLRDAKGNVTRYEYDTSGNPTTIIDALGNATNYVYDAASRLTSLADSLNNTTAFSYDAAGKLIRVTDPLQHTLSREYDAMGNITKEIDPNAVSTSYSYDETNKLIQVDDGLGKTTRYEYDALHNLVRMIDANAAITTNTYDALNRLVEAADPLGKKTRYEYDSAGNVVSFTNGENQIVRYGYDPLDRLMKKTLPDGGETIFAYDKNGNLIHAQNQSIAYGYNYDVLNRAVSVEDSRFGTISYSYDALGNRISLTDPNGHKVSYDYTPRNQLSTLTDFTDKTYSFGYDATGKRTKLALPNGVATMYEYDAASRLTRMESVKSASDILARFVYGYDAQGNRTSREDAKTMTSYEYDPLSQVVKVMDGKLKKEGKNKIVEQYTYDGVGNRLTGPKKQAYAYTSANELLRAGESAFAYDGNGNVISQTRDDAVWKYAYDAENRLLEVVKTEDDGDKEKIAAYFYDPFGRRIKKTIAKDEDGETEDAKVEEYLYDNEDIIAIHNKKSEGTFIVHGPGIDEPLAVTQKGETYYYLFDGLGSIVGLTDNEGEIVQQNEYDSFGNLKQEGDEIKQPYAFTGREFDKETGLYFYRARYYDPKIGRFISRDQVVGSASFPQSLNRYSYVYNNPANYIDPNGDVALLILGPAGAAISEVFYVADVVFTEREWSTATAAGRAAGGFVAPYAFWGALSAGPFAAGGAAAVSSYLVDTSVQATLSSFGFGEAEQFNTNDLVWSVATGVASGSISSLVKIPNVGRNPKYIMTLLTGRETQKALLNEVIGNSIKSILGGIIDNLVQPVKGAVQNGK